MITKSVFPFGLFILPACVMALEFTTEPALIPVGAGQWTASFAVSESTDVEVSIVDFRDSTVIRHLAAGVLGSNPPAPLQAGTLSQSLAWDGNTDAGMPADAEAVPALRVRAGMGPEFVSVNGDNPYRYFESIYGLSLDPDGNLYVLGQYGHLNLEGDHFTQVLNSLRKYTPDGTYEKTLYPLPAGSDLAKASPYGVINLGSGDWHPLTAMVTGPKLGSDSNPITGAGAFLVPEMRDGQFMVCNIPYSSTHGGYNSNGLMTWTNIDTLGNCTPSMATPFIASPALPMKSRYYGPWAGGPFFVTPSPDGKYYLVSGYFEIDTCTISGGVNWIPGDTGFWRDGRIFKVDRNTGTATPWLSLDSIPGTPEERAAVVGPGSVSGYTWGLFTMFGSIHGTAMDDSGHVFVCDRLHQRVSVYDTNAVLLGSIPVEDPDQVVVSRTGAIYVVSRNIEGYSTVTWRWTRYATLRKFPGWRNSPEASITLQNFPPQAWGKINVVLNENGTSPLLWVSSMPGWVEDNRSQYYGLSPADTQSGIWGLRDDADRFTVVKSFSGESRGAVNGFDRVTVDRGTDQVYVNDSWHGLYKIEDWTSPVFARCSTSANAPVDGVDAAVGPDGYLYVREGGCCSRTGGHFRYTQGRLHAPVNYATGSNRASTGLCHHEGGGAADRGLDVTPAGQVGYIGWKTNGINFAAWCPTPGDTAEDTLVFAMPQLCGGFQWGPDGNAYVGVLMRATGHVIPSGYASDWAYEHAVGAVVKVAPHSGAWVDSGGVATASRQAHNALYVYKPGLAPFNWTGDCVCRSPRFDVDPFGRLFLPNAITGKVAVVDNNDNPIMSFGEYGNTDSRGQGSLVPTPAIPLLWPTGVASSEDYIYVTDMGNERLLRVRMAFGLDNMPGLTDPMGVAAGKGGSRTALTMAATPNPFNPEVRITLSGGLSRGVSLRVYDLNGRLVADLSGSFNNGRTVWNAAGNASGVYVLTAKKCNMSTSKRIVHSK